MRSLLVAVLALISINSPVFAQAPDSLSFQGFLTNAGGVVVADGNYNLLMKMYKGSSKVWEQNHVGVPVAGGVFNIILSGTPTYPLDTVAFNQPIELGIAVNGGDEMTPRTLLTAAAYARGMPGLYTFYRDTGSRQSYNVVGGAANNIVGAGVTGATIGGGGGHKDGTQRRNQVLDFWGTVAGGYENIASGRGSVVGGGFENTANQPHSAVAGGWGNTADGFGSVVGGGEHNSAGADYATIPGGTENSALGSSSFAAGQKANAIHSSTFVWNDGFGSLVSTGANQFLISAFGGVGIGTNAPSSDLTVNGDADFTGDVGIGTNAPVSNSRLHVHHGSVGTNDWGLVLTNSTISAFRMGMRLANSGFVEITNNAKNSGPNFSRLDNTGNWTAVSDRRLKTDIEPASGMLQAALELEPVRYHFKNQSDQGQKSLGMIAQQVQEVVPSLVTDSDPMTLNYSGMSVVAIGAIRELYEVVQEQAEIIEKQNLRIARLETTMGSQ